MASTPAGMLVYWEVLLSFVLAVSAALASHLSLARGRGWRIGGGAIAGLAILLSPLVIPGDCPFARLVGALASVVILTKLIDLFVSSEHPTPLAFLAHLANIFSLVRRKLEAEPRPAWHENLARLSGGLVALIAALVVFQQVFRADWTRSGFALEHVVKVLALFGVIIPGSVVGVAGLRLTGGRARDFMDHPYAARTPADFWRRYNRPAQQFLYEDVFKVAGGLRAPVRSTLVTFAFSAIVHEYLFSVAIGRVQGYQTLFFMLQGFAVVATWRVKPRGWEVVPWVVGTLAFNLATSVFFFASVAELVPFYSRGLPAWLRV